MPNFVSLMIDKSFDLLTPTHDNKLDKLNILFVELNFA